MLAVDTMLVEASEAGIASNIATIQQQLQQSGMLQQLSAVLAAMTTELRVETAALAAGGWDAASGDVQQFTAAYALQPHFASVANLRSVLWEFWLSQGISPPADWLFGSSGHAVAVAQFATAGLQHVSSVVQHVLPAVRERLPQRAAWFARTLLYSSQLAALLCIHITILKTRPLPPPQQQGQRSEAGAWQQLLLSLIWCLVWRMVDCFQSAPDDVLE
jgi:hypothetical protein